LLESHSNQTETNVFLRNLWCFVCGCRGST
jgi:hypothetical protein